MALSDAATRREYIISLPRSSFQIGTVDEYFVSPLDAKVLSSFAFLFFESFKAKRNLHETLWQVSDIALQLEIYRKKISEFDS